MSSDTPHPLSPSLRAVENRLLTRIERRYPTIRQIVEVGTLRFSFTRVADPDRVLDEVAEAEDRAERLSGKRTDGDFLHLPYWAEVWDSALGIAYVLAEQRWTAPRSVLDLGCGMGLAGTAAAGLGARVLFADLEPPALLFAKLNSLPWEDRVRTRQLDWRRDRLDERFDLILGADILYERKQWDFLEPFWREHLSDGGSILLGEPGRQTGDLFVPWIEARGWKLKTEGRKVPTRETPIRLFELRVK